MKLGSDQDHLGIIGVPWLHISILSSFFTFLQICRSIQVWQTLSSQLTVTETEKRRQTKGIHCPQTERTKEGNEKGISQH